VLISAGRSLPGVRPAQAAESRPERKCLESPRQRFNGAGDERADGRHHHSLRVRRDNHDASCATIKVRIVVGRDSAGRSP